MLAVEDNGDGFNRSCVTLSTALPVLSATLGTISGYRIDYVLGRFVLARFATRWSTSKLGRRIRLAGRLRLARQLITKHGGKAILISHLIGQVRSFVALGAGMTRMKYVRFLGYEVMAAAPRDTASLLPGHLLAATTDRVTMGLQCAGGCLPPLLLR